MLQDSVIVSGPGHSLPPWWAGWSLVLFNVLFPPPHDSEHVDQELFFDHVQCTWTIEYMKNETLIIDHRETCCNIIINN